MNWELSKFGETVGGESGIFELMEDLGRAMTSHPDMLMMGGGNPAPIPAVQKIWRDRIRELVEVEPERLDRALVNYDPPAGNPRFRAAVAQCLREAYDWPVTEKNVAVTSGGQSAFFYLFNSLAGEFSDGRHKKVLLPLLPEYIGYANQGVAPELFVTCQPKITEFEDWTFKYHVDFDRVYSAADECDLAAICVSRPTNPTGNVLDNSEIDRLSDLASAKGVPLIIDNAYGFPFPGVIFKDAAPVWDDHIILTMSLSKLGLPGTRTAVVIAREEIIGVLERLTSVCGLANGNIGQAMVTPMLENGDLMRISRDVIRPYYEERSQRAMALLQNALADAGGEISVHRSEGAFFFWVWFKNLPITTADLYNRLKARNLLVVPGKYFFFGQGSENWKHRDECIRMTFSQSEAVVEEGIGILADEIRSLTAGAV